MASAFGGQRSIQLSYGCLGALYYGNCGDATGEGGLRTGAPKGSQFTLAA